MQWVNTWRSHLFLQKIKDFFLSLKNMHLKFENPRRNCSPSFHRQSIKEHRKVICYQSMMPVERIKSTPSEIYENSAFSSYRICNFRRKTHFPGINQKVNGCRCLFVKFFWDFFLSDKLNRREYALAFRKNIDMQTRHSKKKKIPSPISTKLISIWKL